MKQRTEQVDQPFRQGVVFERMIDRHGGAGPGWQSCCMFRGECGKDDLPPANPCLTEQSSNFKPVEKADIPIGNIPHQRDIAFTPCLWQESNSPHIHMRLRGEAPPVWRG